MSNSKPFGAVPWIWLLISLLLAPWALAETPDVAKARAYLDAGKARTAVITLKNRLQEEPEDAAARLLLGRIYLGMRDFPSAEKELERARDLGAQREKWLPALAEARLRQGRLEEALGLLDPAEADTAALKARIAVLRGRILGSQGRAEEAGEAYDRATHHKEGFLPAQLGHARLALKAGEQERAEKLLQRIRKRDPERAKAWLLTGKLRFGQGKAQGAATAYERAVELDPENPRPALGLAAVRLAIGETAASREVVQKWLDKGITSPRFRFLKALIALRQDRADEARSILESLVARHELPPAHLHLGRLAFQEERYETAVHHLRRYREHHPDKVPPAKLLAVTWLRKGAPERAVQVLAPLRQAGRQDPGFLALLGRSRIGAGAADAGFRDLQEAARIAPKDKGIRAQVALGYLAGGRTQKAVPALQKVIELNPDQVGARYLLVLNHVQAKNFAKAAAAAEELVKRDPDNPVGQNLVGLAVWGEGKTERARKQFRSALDAAPDFQGARLNLARMDLQAGMPEEARNRFKRVLDKEPDNRGALLGMVELAKRAEDKKAYGRWLERAWSAHAPDPAIGLKLARLRVEKGNLLPALEIARDLEGAHPDDPRVLALLGRVQQANGNLASAATALERLVELRPQSPGARVSLAKVHRSRDKRDAAGKQIDKALELDPEHAGALLLRARMALADGEDGRALELGERLSRATPESPMGQLVMGQAHVKAGEKEAAEKAFQAALERGPNRPAALALFRIRQGQGRVAEAEAALQRWLEARPGDADVRVLLAQYRQSQDDTGGAIQAYEKALESAPERPSLLNNLAWLYLKQDDPQALAYARKAHELAPDRPEITDTLGWAHVRLGQVQKGLRLLEDAAIHAPHIPSIRYHRAAALAKTGREGEAREELVQLLDSDKAFNDAEEARSLLRSLKEESGR
ncbi:XrtA/PEP-CTERM system TPR-repeat protein PrsT [Thiohalorhabdus sp.]|uniref:XrtA/PEP-CTERM system TPR-repeat protein PrsT n=1 Tax=Thiohalorhabdus sp. TaxID=3094134 RepID=UPI002FC38A39